MSRSPEAASIGSWRLVPGADLHWRNWDERYVLFNSASGQTHIVDPVAALIIEEIARGSGAEMLFQRLAQLLDLDLTIETQTKLQETLKHLDALGLIEATVP